jgi:hypothetical protein
VGKGQQEFETNAKYFKYEETSLWDSFGDVEEVGRAQNFLAFQDYVLT